MRAVNLLPRDEGRTRRQPGAVLLTAVLGSVLLTAVLCGWFMMASSGVSDKQAQLDGSKAELLAIPPPEPPDTSQSTLVAEKDARLTVLGTALGNRIAWDRVLREVSLVLPEDVWLETMSTNGPIRRPRQPLRHRARPLLRPSVRSRSPATRTRTTASPGSWRGSP